MAAVVWYFSMLYGHQHYQRHFQHVNIYFCLLFATSFAKGEASWLFLLPEETLETAPTAVCTDAETTEEFQLSSE